MSNKQRVVAIALDAVSFPVLESWMADGTLPNLAEIRRQGAYGRLNNPGSLLYENSWLNFLQGNLSTTNGQWGHQFFDKDDYSSIEFPGFDLAASLPFYARPPFPRTAVFDLPLTPLSSHVNGIQILGWGTEENQCQQFSSPPGLLSELQIKYGGAPLFESNTRRVSHNEAILSFRNPSLYDEKALANLKDLLLEGIRRRTEILLDLLKRDAWDLFLAAFAEAHIAGHLLWHTDLSHPLGSAASSRGLLREIYVALDRAIGELTADIPKETMLLLFAVHGMKPNNTDLNSLLFLPEALYRWQFGKAAIADGGSVEINDKLPLHYRAHWKDEVWALATPQGQKDLISPARLESEEDPQDWCPLRWYAPLWPNMSAFALHSYSHGMIRINVAGREGKGCVKPDDYDDICSSLEDMLKQLRCARSGEPLVGKLWRTRKDPFDEGKHIPPADIMVEWTNHVTDMVSSPITGQIGPVPYFRSGGHGPRGFCIMRGPKITEDSDLPADMQVTDLSHQIKQWLGAPPIQ